MLEFRYNKIALIRMSDNKKASIRYEALDKCFRNTSRRFFIEDLRRACNEALYRETGDPQYSDPDKPCISKKQIYDDIQFLMCSPEYYAPIEKSKEGRFVYYFYSDPTYSILKKPLTDEEITKLESALQVFLTFNGLPQFEWIEDIVCKLKSKYKVAESGQNVVSFDSNIDIAGLGFFNDIYGYIVNKQPICVNYEPFGKTPIQISIHPYFLKQFNNRWFVFGRSAERGNVTTLALDRIKSIEPKHLDYVPDTIIEDINEYLFDAIGVSGISDLHAEDIKLKFSENRFPYIISKPLHPSMKINQSEREVSLHVIVNKELKSLILSFGSDVEVLSPSSLREEIRDILKNTCEKYECVRTHFTHRS